MTLKSWEAEIEESEGLTYDDATDGTYIPTEQHSTEAS